MLQQVAQYYRGDNAYYPMNHMVDGADENRWLALVCFGVFVSLVGVALYVVYKIANQSTAASQGKDPLDIAKERYAKGEISKEDLADIKKELLDK